MKVWQLQEAKQRFSELIRAAESEGPQVVSRHGKDVAVVIDIDTYRDSGSGADFKDYLAGAPSFDGLELDRDPRAAPVVDLR